MDDDGNVRTSTLVVGALVSLGLLVLGTLVATTFLPKRFAYSGALPALIFVHIYIYVHRGKNARRRRP